MFAHNQLTAFAIIVIALVLWYTFGLPWAIDGGTTIGLIIGLGSMLLPLIGALVVFWEMLHDHE